jgi:hypothetical protein
VSSAAQIARERERIRRALAYVQRRLGTSFDVRVEHCKDDSVEMSMRPRAWPQEPRAFILGFDARFCVEMTTQELRETVIHELLHAITWPLREFAMKGLSERAADEWADRIEEPVVRELSRIVSTHALGRWSQR